VTLDSDVVEGFQISAADLIYINIFGQN